jgi:mycothiol synthase
MLLEAASADLRRAGCRTVEAIAVAGSDGAAFAGRLGAAVGDELVDGVLRFAKISPLQMQTLRVPPPGYVLWHWRGRAPSSLVESYARAKRSIADAPNRHPPVVPAWDTALVRAHEQARADCQVELWVTAAVAAGTANVVAFTEIETIGTAPDASQVDTVVLPAHRRKGLASAVKADLLLQLRTARPGLVSIGVTCALANTGMRAVNHRLGFREQQRRTLYRLGL